MAQLTKPQLTMLTRALRAGSVPVSGAGYRVADRLTALGFGEVQDQLFRISCFGLAGLRDHWCSRWAKDGCHAYLLNMQEAEKALAAEQASA